MLLTSRSQGMPREDKINMCLCISVFRACAACGAVFRWSGVLMVWRGRVGFAWSSA